MILSAQGRLAEARAEFEAAVAGRPALAQPRLNLAALLIRAGELPRARALVEEASRYVQDPQENEAVWELRNRLRSLDAVTPLASAIVLNHNGRGYVEAAVASLLEQDLAPLEVLVVDNGSTDGSDAALEQRFGARIRMLRAGSNLGFGAGNNLAFEPRGRRTSCCSTTTRWRLPASCASWSRRPRPIPHRDGGGKVLDPEGDCIDTVGHLLYPDGLNRGRGRLEPDRGQYDACRDALFPSGAAGLYRRAMLDEVGLFDEAFFLYGDDAELGLRGRLAGWGCALAPRAVAYHHYSRSAGAYSSLKAFHVERNRVLILLELFPLVLILLSPFFTVARLSLHAWGALVGRGAAARLAHDTSLAHLVGVTLRAYWAALAWFRMRSPRARASVRCVGRHGRLPRAAGHVPPARGRGGPQGLGAKSVTTNGSAPRGVSGCSPASSTS